MCPTPGIMKGQRMIKAINVTGWILLLAAFMTGEKINPPTFIALVVVSAACFWLSHALYKEVLNHRYTVQDAPIASSVSRDLRIEV
jgi:hypothetical protein